MLVNVKEDVLVLLGWALPVFIDILKSGKVDGIPSRAVAHHPST